MLFKDCLCFTLSRASRKISRAYRERLDAYGLTQSQFFLLLALYEESGVSITTLAEKVALDKSTLTGLLDRMERDGLVTRGGDAEDRRQSRVDLTEKALGLRTPIEALYDETNSCYLKRLTSEEREFFDRVLQKIETPDPRTT